jgi:hypothetical protein
MAFNYKVLGQSAPAATTATDIYTAPSATQAVISVITVCNRSSTAASYRIAIRPAGASLANQHYIAYDVVVGGNDSTNISNGYAIAATDVITVYGSTANLSFTISGSEITT